MKLSLRIYQPSSKFRSAESDLGRSDNSAQAATQIRIEGCQLSQLVTEKIYLIRSTLDSSNWCVPLTCGPNSWLGKITEQFLLENNLFILPTVKRPGE